MMRRNVLGALIIVGLFGLIHQGINGVVITAFPAQYYQLEAAIIKTVLADDRYAMPYPPIKVQIASRATYGDIARYISERIGKKRVLIAPKSVQSFCDIITKGLAYNASAQVKQAETEIVYAVLEDGYALLQLINGDLNDLAVQCRTGLAQAEALLGK